ncbi:restriction endonuclease subunit S [Collinsella sp. TF08-11AT]|uniref:restriction endonuclease subunit S n=1 Tax=Collinsella sp. TF08-11AT TaxID=2292333 RepID=UPI000E443B6F|nr:restriction endonuclease subunit S [Collinsella sp. TF08-11AT]RGL14329.1 restriction endonuclease subunit S [Collinsella sp. TF08-11AT]
MSWTQKTLGEIVNLKRGFDLPSSSRVDGPYPVFSSSGQTGTHSEAAVKGPCVVTGRYGTIGQVFFSDAACWPLNTSLYSTDFKGNDPKFVYYLLKTIPWRDYLTASAVPGINRNHVHLCPVCVPDHETQTAISGVLGLLDNKIELNTKLNGYLVKACDVLYSNYTAGEQAAEWPMGTLEDLLEIRYGKDHKKLDDGNIPVYGSGGYMRSVDRFLYSGESVLIPRKGSLNNVMYVSKKFWTVDTMFYAVPKSPNVAKYAYQFIKRLDLASMNSGSAVPSMTTKILNALPVPIPPKESLHAFDDQLQPYYSAICANAIENELLAALRDALLPKLMSGEIDVSKVDLTQLNSHLA